MSLVDFIIGGAAKSGTRSLYNFLCGHPDVCVSQPKEVNYFSKYYEDQSLDAYRGYFDHCGAGQLRGEASTSYLEFAERTAPRIRNDVPDVRLLFILRDPVDRAYSDYWYAVRQGRLEHREGLFGELVRGAVSIPDYWRPQYDTGERIVRRGMYHDALTTYYERFGGSQIQVLLTRELSSAGEKVCEFLDLEPHTDEVPRSNTGQYPVNGHIYALYRGAKDISSLLPDVVTENMVGMKEWVGSQVFQQKNTQPPMDSETREYLSELYREPNRKLERLIERDLSGWT